jgi:hypothetical protein
MDSLSKSSSACRSDRNEYHESDDDDDDDDSVIESFPRVDFHGVDFDTQPIESTDHLDNNKQSYHDKLVYAERQMAFANYSEIVTTSKTLASESLSELGTWLEEGNYARALKHSAMSSRLFSNDLGANNTASSTSLTVHQILRRNVIAIGEESLEACIELELIGIAALNLFLQSNYTGPSLLDADEAVKLEGIHPHSCFIPYLSLSSSDKPNAHNNPTTTKDSTSASLYQNAILSELAVDGHWPCPVSNHPYFLLIARSILGTLADPNRTSSMQDSLLDEESSFESKINHLTASSMFVKHTKQLQAVPLWSGRAVVAHVRLLQTRQPPVTLWNEAEFVFQQCMETYKCSSLPVNSNNHNGDVPNPEAATIMLEWGLAEHHFDRPKKGKLSFLKARDWSGLDMEITGATGTRTKYQVKATAQMLVRAKSTKTTNDEDKADEKGGEEKDDIGAVDDRNTIREQMIEHPEDGILLEKIRFDDEKENKVQDLNILDQSILLALCLDVKNNNPADGLTGEEMGAFLGK